MAKSKEPKHPMQPVVFDEHAVVRFKANAIVHFLVDYAASKGMSLNELASLPFSKEDWTQLAQLLGYSVSGAGDLAYFDRDVIAQADAEADRLIAERRK